MTDRNKNISFKEGLEDLLKDAFSEEASDAVLLQSNSVKSDRSKSQTKNFTSDLSSMFEEALKESVEEQIGARKGNPLLSKKPKIPRSGGLDSLIKSTVETSSMSMSENKKRVTFIFDQKKLDKLKTIARVKKTYLKNIVDDLVSEYIDEYEQKKGV